LARAAGVSDTQLSDLPRFRYSDAFDADEKLVLELAEVVTSTPALVSDDLRQRLLDRFTAPAVTELAAAIAWENNRGRLNQALGVRSAGFSRGEACALPEQTATPTV
jgi:alkylhydroperoxidase family enzyme